MERWHKTSTRDTVSRQYVTTNGWDRSKHRLSKRAST